MVQIHKEFTESQVKELIERYLKNEIERKYGRGRPCRNCFAGNGGGAVIWAHLSKVHDRLYLPRIDRIFLLLTARNTGDLIWL